MKNNCPECNAQIGKEHIYPCSHSLASKFEARIAKLESINAELLAACEKYVYEAEGDLIEDGWVQLNRFKAAIAKAREVME